MKQDKIADLKTLFLCRTYEIYCDILPFYPHESFVEGVEFVDCEVIVFRFLSMETARKQEVLENVEKQGKCP
jgi:hypothetical protein